MSRLLGVLSLSFFCLVLFLSHAPALAGSGLQCPTGFKSGYETVDLLKLAVCIPTPPRIVDADGKAIGKILDTEFMLNGHITSNRITYILSIWTPEVNVFLALLQNESRPPRFGTLPRGGLAEVRFESTHCSGTGWIDVGQFEKEYLGSQVPGFVVGDPNGELRLYVPTGEPSKAVHLRTHFLTHPLLSSPVPYHCELYEDIYPEGRFYPVELAIRNLNEKYRRPYRLELN